jgi:hypothetical protein
LLSSFSSRHGSLRAAALAPDEKMMPDARARAHAHAHAHAQYEPYGESTPLLGASGENGGASRGPSSRVLSEVGAGIQDGVCSEFAGAGGSWLVAGTSGRVWDAA